jgi:hypothetical protein
VGAGWTRVAWCRRGCAAPAATALAASGATESHQRGLRGDALGGAALHLIEEQHVPGVVKGDAPGVRQEDLTRHVVTLVQTARKHGDEGVVRRRLLAVAESVCDGLDAGAVLRHAEAPLALFMEIRREVDGAVTTVVEEDVAEGDVQLPRRLRGVHDHPDELAGDGPVNPPLEDGVDGSPLDVGDGRGGVRREMVQHAVLLHGEFQESAPLGIRTRGQVEGVGNDVADLDAAHLERDRDARRCNGRSGRNLGEGEDGRGVERLTAGRDSDWSSGAGAGVGDDGRREAVGGSRSGRHRIDQTDTMKGRVLIFGVHKTALCFSYINSTMYRSLYRVQGNG